MPSSLSRPLRVAVTGLGVVSPLGWGAEQTRAALRQGRDCVSEVTDFDVAGCRSHTAGRVDTAEGPELQRVPHREALHPASKMMVAATRDALGEKSAQPEAMVIGTTSGGMGYGEAFYRAQLERRPNRRRAGWLANYLPQKPALDAQRECGFSAPIDIIANACASGTNALGHAFGLIRSGQARAVLCGGYDVISELVFVGFDSLQAATPEKIRPFDKDRTGLVLGEGAAMFMLESWDAARERGAEILAEITGYGISTDNHHLTQPHPSGIGPLQAMRRALSSAGRQPEEVDYVNAHGTATTFNDATEGAAIAELFGTRAAVSSTKSMMGHALGAAGAIEAAFCMLALQDGFLPPNINLQELDPSLRIDLIANQTRAGECQVAISNSFGFGGTNAAIVIERPSFSS